MCGACGRVTSTDDWSDLVATRRSRWEASRLVNEALVRSGHPGRVTCATGPWVVSSGTGKSVLADTLSQMWAQLASLHPISAATLHPLVGDVSTSTAQAVLEAAERARSDTQTTPRKGSVAQ